MKKLGELFGHASRKASHWFGTPWAFIAAVLVVVVWAASGPAAQFSTTWQLIINTGTTIVTFLMVFVIQNTQNRENEAIQLKLDELIRAVAEAQTSFVDLEDVSDEEMELIRKNFAALRKSVGATREASASAADGGSSGPGD